MKDQTWRQRFKSLDSQLTKNDLIVALEIILLAIEESKAEIMASIDDVIDEVTQESTVIDGVVTLLNNVEQQLKDALANAQVPQAVADKINAVAAMIANNKQKLADAVVANTPAAPGGTSTSTDQVGSDGGDTGNPAPAASS